MVKLAALLIATLCCTGCAAVSTRWEAGKFSIRHDNVKGFAITNNKHPQEPVAVIVRPHEATLNLHYSF